MDKLKRIIVEEIVFKSFLGLDFLARQHAIWRGLAA